MAPRKRVESIMLSLGLALAVVIGLSLGLLGGGGSVLTVPVLVYVVGVGAKPAIAMSLPVVGITSLVGAGVHWRFGNVRFRTAAVFGVVAMIGAYLGARLANLISGPTQLVFLAIAMFGAAIPMLRASRSEPSVSERKAVLSPMIFPAALLVGLLTGLVGIGGGFLVVPALVLLAGVPMRQAVGTSLVVIAMNSASGFAGYVGSVAIDWPLLAGFTACAAGGALGGVVLSRHVPQHALKQGFAAFLIATSTFVLYKNF
jgi:uncharacterized membrane protein YfcA